MNYKYYILIPENLDLYKLTEKYPPQFDFNYDFAHLVIHCIIEKSAFKIKSNITDKIYIPLSSTILKNFNRDYDKHMNYLRERFPNTEKILWRQNYGVGKCFSFKLSPFYSQKKLKHAVLTDLRLIKKIRAQKMQKNPDPIKHKKMMEAKNKFKTLINYFNPEKLTIELRDALNQEGNLLEENGNYNKYALNAIKIIKIQNGEYFFSHKPETDGRFHSSITTFPKHLRKHLRYNGEKLAEIDISASVPFMFYYLLSNINNTNSNLYNIITPNKNYHINYMLAKDSVSLGNREIQHFGDLVLKGKFYESFIPDFDKLCIDNNSYWQYISIKKRQKELFAHNNFRMEKAENELSYEEKKNVLKKNILSMLNAKCGNYKYEEQIFKNKFSTIYEFIQTFKKEEHKPFSHMMLQIESFFMLKIIARNLNNKHKRQIPFFTLHDCIITTESNMLFVKNFMEENFAKEMGFIPVLKEEVFI